MTRRQALEILGLREGVGLDDIKRTYRKLAFSLHPDLHPENADAGRDFQRLNEAYVLLSSPESTSRQAPRGASRNAERAEATERARADAQRAYARAKKRFEDTQNSPGTAGRAEQPKTRETRKEEVLRDLLRDPFARRVFEDIYSQIRSEASRKKTDPKPGVQRRAPVPRKSSSGPGILEKTADNVSDWFRRQIDDEQTVHFNGELTPGKRIRLQIHHGVFGKSQTIELQLPTGFEPGRPIRLKGLGKRIGKWRGDLYLRILPQ